MPGQNAPPMYHELSDSMLFEGVNVDLSRSTSSSGQQNIEGRSPSGYRDDWPPMSPAISDRDNRSLFSGAGGGSGGGSSVPEGADCELNPLRGPYRN